MWGLVKVAAFVGLADAQRLCLQLGQPGQFQIAGVVRVPPQVQMIRPFRPMPRQYRRPLFRFAERRRRLAAKFF